MMRKENHIGALYKYMRKRKYVITALPRHMVHKVSYLEHCMTIELNFQAKVLSNLVNIEDEEECTWHSSFKIIDMSHAKYKKYLDWSMQEGNLSSS